MLFHRLMADVFRIKNLPDIHILRKFANRYPHSKINPENLEALLLLNRVSGDVFNFFRKDFDEHGLTSARFTLLLRLRREPEVALNPSDLSDYLGVTRATISGLLDGLEKSKQIKRVSCEDDRRCCFVQITTKGIKLIDKIAPDYFSQISSLLTNFKKSEIKIFKKILLLLSQELSNKNDS